MSNHSPHPNSISPHTTKSQSSAFVWPIPNSPSQIKPNNNNMNELSVREILDRYNEDPELLKYILTAKSEEDKRKAAKDTLKAEEARIQLRQMDLDLAREQTKASSRYERSAGHLVAFAPPPHVQHHPPPPQSAHPAAYGPYYGLAPVQQQVLARFNHPAQYGNQQQHPPASPSVPYPHSAHPLCPPSTSTTTDEKPRLTQQQFRQKSPSSPVTAADDSSSLINIKKRSRSSISSSPNEPSIDQQQQQHQDKLSHNKVMEALKAKIQRGNGGPPSPLTASPIRSSLLQQQDSNKKRKPTLPRPVIVHQQVVEGSSPSPSPRSAKPVLPPIDTNLGRMDNNKSIVSEVQKSIQEETAITSSTSTSSTSSTNNSSSTTNSSSSMNEKPNASQQQQQQQQQEVASPSDHILLNTRRARSLSPSSSSLLVKNA